MGQESDAEVVLVCLCVCSCTCSVKAADSAFLQDQLREKEETLQEKEDSLQEWTNVLLVLVRRPSSGVVATPGDEHHTPGPWKRLC